MKKEDYTKEVLLNVLGSYLKQIENFGKEYPTVVLGDIKASINGVLKANDYESKYKSNLKK